MANSIVKKDFSVKQIISGDVMGELTRDTDACSRFNLEQVNFLTSFYLCNAEFIICPRLRLGQGEDKFAKKSRNRKRAVCDDLVKRYIYARRKIFNLYKAWKAFKKEKGV